MEVESQCQQDSNWNPVSNTIDVPTPWSGRVWARFECSNDGGSFHCNSGDCGSGQVGCNGAGGTPPATLAEFTIGGADGKDFFDVSLVDGFNLPLSIVPQDGCAPTDCPADINAKCPSELAVKNGSGGTIGCKSACEAFGTPEYCCSGDHNTPDKCPPTDYSRKSFSCSNPACPGILSVQASSVASESAFSTSGRILSIRRTRLTAESLEMCMCLKDHLDAHERRQHTTPLELPLDVEEGVFNDEHRASYFDWKWSLSANRIRIGIQCLEHYVPTPWSGRVWARFECSNDGGSYHCNSGDCGSGQVGCNGAGGAPPATLAEFTIGGADGKDFFDVSLVDGFNLPVSIVPQDGCAPTDCPADINAKCPSELAVKNGSGGTIGCKSACEAFGTPEYCCSGDHNTPDKCPPTDYSRFFKNLCPKAYSYAYDDSTSTFTCKTGANYVITFCP
ncbi:thaumatin-like protein 1 [Tanacetum coccineum]